VNITLTHASVAGLLAMFFMAASPKSDVMKEAHWRTE
jgi:hypothetical protein